MGTHLPKQRTAFHPWSGKILLASERPSPAPQPLSPGLQGLCSTRSPRSEQPAGTSKESLAHRSWRKPACSSEDPGPPKIKINFVELSFDKALFWYNQYCWDSKWKERKEGERGGRLAWLLFLFFPALDFFNWNITAVRSRAHPCCAVSESAACAHMPPPS